MRTKYVIKIDGHEVGETTDKVKAKKMLEGYVKMTKHYNPRSIIIEEVKERTNVKS